MVYSAGVRKVLWEVTSKLAVKDEQDLARQNFMLSQNTAGSPGQPQITSATDDHTFSSSESPVSQLRWTLRHHLQGVDLVKGGLLW